MCSDLKSALWWQSWKWKCHRTDIFCVFNFSFFQQRALFKCQYTFSIFGQLVKKATFKFLSTAKQGDNALGSVRPCVCLFVCLCVCLSELSCLNHLTYDLDFWHGGRPWPCWGWDCRSRSYVIGQRSRSNAKNYVLTSLLCCFKVKVKGRGQGHMSRSMSGQGQILAVDNRGSALLSAAKSNKSR